MVEKKTCLIRLREELNIQEIARITAFRKHRAFIKWSSAKTYISVCIKQKARFRKATWVSGSERWLNSYAHSMGDEPDRKCIKGIFEDRLKNKDKSVHSLWLKQDCGVVKPNLDWLSFMLRFPRLRRGAFALGQILIGIFPTGKSLANIGLIEEKFKKVCIFCDRDGEESIEHMLFVCSKWNDIRMNYFTHREFPPAELCVTAGGLLGRESFDDTILSRQY